MSQQLEERFYKYAEEIRDGCLLLKWDVVNAVYIKQLIRSSSSVGAHYIEASDCLGTADEKMKLKIIGREAKANIYWLKLILAYNKTNLDEQRLHLINESEQIKKILSSIITIILPVFRTGE